MKLTAKEKVSYGLGAVGKDMVYMLSASYILYYYQDILGVSAIAMGIILMAARVFDAFNDPIMGVLVAKTKTKWVCQSCGYESFSYLGRCPDCGNFATFCEEVVQDAPQLKTNSAPSLILNNELKVQKINEVENDEKT